MPLLWGHRLAAFVPPLAFAVVPPLVLLAFAVVPPLVLLALAVVYPLVILALAVVYPLVPLVSGGMVSHRLPSVAFPFRLSSALSLDLLVLLSLLDLSPLSATLSPPIQGLSYTYSYLSSELPTAPGRV